MASCKLDVVLDGDKRSFVSREAIRGQVRVQVGEECRCDGLHLSLTLRSFGQGLPAVETLRTWQLFSGTWSAGEPLSYPFEVPAPAFPPSYRGDVLGWDWHVEARADLPMARDARASEAIDLQLPASPGLAVVATEQGCPEDAGQRSARHFIGCAVWIPAMIGLASWGIFDGDWQKIVGGIVMALAGGALLALWLSQWRRVGRAGSLSVAVREKGAVGYREAGGEAGGIECTVWAHRDAPIREVEVAVDVEERASSGSGKAHQSHVGGLWLSTTQLAATATPGEYRGLLELPEPGKVPYSMILPNNRIVWKAHITARLSSGQAIRTTVPLRAEPARGPGSAHDRRAQQSA